jgi:4-amino-4-deoxy-L-arabinose transferase-like glycosyltransferase
VRLGRATASHTADSRTPVLDLPPRPSRTPSLNRGLQQPIWWLCLVGLWALASACDRLWLAIDQRLPSWDQADYLNSALDHGRALGLIHPGGWSGWAALLDLSPKIPPLASLVNGTVMALAGDGPDQASWALAVWHALLLVVIACWGRQLLGSGFGLLCATLVVLTPALAHPRVDYTLDLPLAATACLALWLLGRWQAPAPAGGRWPQALAAAGAVAAALLVKQSALLLLVGPVAWSALRGLAQGRRRLQVLLAAALVLALVLPWLRHNWITTLGGTNRAVVESAAAEGDPPWLSLASLTWYPRLLPGQLGVVGWPVLPVAGVRAWRAGQALRRRWKGLPPLERANDLGMGARQADNRAGVATRAGLSSEWTWLLVCVLSGWLFTTLSPNKDARYITPVLPMVVMLVARAWWELGGWLRRRWGGPGAWAMLLAGLAGATSASALRAAAEIHRDPPAPVPQLTGRLRELVGEAPTTLLVVPGHPELNEQTVTTFGRRAGGRIEGRRLGRSLREHPLALARSQWVLLATGDQGTNRPFSRVLSHRVRSDGRFARVAAWPWSEGRQVELWKRNDTARATRFDADFIRLARGMEQGPAGLAALFARIGPEHQLDAHFQYQQRVQRWALRRLQRQSDDRDALWSLALIATLRNRPEAASHWYGLLQRQLPANPWPQAYRAVVLLAGWHPSRAFHALNTTPEPRQQNVVLQALTDISGVLSGRIWRLSPLRESLPKAIHAVKEQLESAQKARGNSSLPIGSK